MDNLTVCVAGATGWAGSALCRGIAEAPDLALIGGVARRQAGKTLGEALGLDGLEAPIRATVEEAMHTHPDVFVEYTKPGSAKSNVLAALQGGAHVVVATSGLGVQDYEEINQAALAANRGVLAVGNFALTAVLLQKFAAMAAKYIPDWEIIEYAGPKKRDAPSGTVRELANRLAAIGESRLEVPLDEIEGHPETRGGRLQGTQVHALRLPGYTLSIDAVFGMGDEKLVIRHEAGASAQPYVAGGLIAIREVGNLVGLHRGLDSVMAF